MDYEEHVSQPQVLGSSFATLMRKVYLWMTLALVITGLTAYQVATSETILGAIATSPGLLIVLIVAELGLVIGLSSAIHKISLTTATLLFVLYSLLNGVNMSFIFLAYTATSIAQVFFMAAGMFGAMALWGAFTKKDLSGWGRTLMMGLIGMLIVMVVSLFFTPSSQFSLLISIVVVLLFVGLTAYDSQKIKEMMMVAPDAGETMQKVALLGALTLYLDFINIFIYLLRIFGNRRD